MLPGFTDTIEVSLLAVHDEDGTEIRRFREPVLVAADFAGVNYDCRGAAIVQNLGKLFVLGGCVQNNEDGVCLQGGKDGENSFE